MFTSVRKASASPQAKIGSCARVARYQTKQKDCASCSSREQCCSGNGRNGRSIVVTHEDPVVSAFRARQASPRTRALLRDRGRVAELANAWLKEKLGLRRFHVHGLAKVTTETLWAVLTYNIQQWIRLR
jgi:Transposase DDE domain